MQNDKLSFLCPACKKVHEFNALNMEEDQGFLISGVGWDEHPEEINNSAMVKFCFVSILSRNEEKAWIVIRIEDVLLLKEADTRLKSREIPETSKEFDLYNSSYIFGNEEWLYIASGTQGNIGSWALLKKNINHYNLILEGHWDV